MIYLAWGIGSHVAIDWLKKTYDEAAIILSIHKLNISLCFVHYI